MVLQLKRWEVIWSGPLPPPQTKPSFYSRKVFFGGIPRETTEDELMKMFRGFGVEAVKFAKEDAKKRRPQHGYVYLCFKEETSVNALLSRCDQNETKTEYFFKWRKVDKPGKFKELYAEIIPWNFVDTFWISASLPSDGAGYVVYIAGLHGLMTADFIAKVFGDLFGNIGAVLLSKDKFGYPTGSGKVSFTSVESYQRAVLTGYLRISSKKFGKTILVDPFIDGSAQCADCGDEGGRYFCRKTQECIKLCCGFCIIKHRRLAGHPF